MPIFAFVGIAVATTVLVSIWIRISLRKNIMDVPTHRSSHTTATPRGGGTGIVTVVIVALLVGAFLLRNRFDPEPIVWAAGLGLFLAVISFVDDVRSLSSLLRLVLQVGVAIAAVTLLGKYSVITIPFLDPIPLPQSISYAATVVWIVGMTNVYNFMDGIDGIAGGQGVVAGLAWAGYGQFFGQPLVTWIGLAIAASCAGFLTLNWSPAKVFMGDVGSAFLGFMFAIVPLVALREGDTAKNSIFLAGSIPIFGLMVVWPFVGDGVFTFLRRLKNKENVLEAHRSHLYQRLTISGWSHAAVSSLYIAWGTLSAALGAVYLSGGDYAQAVAGTGITVLVILMFAFVKLREPASSNGKTSPAP